MSSEKSSATNICMVGPTRVGKTSIIASILKDTQSLLAGTELSLKPAPGSQTERRISEHARELRRSLDARSFDPGSVAGTQESFLFELELDLGVQEEALKINFYDFPGGWINTATRSARESERWKEALGKISESEALIIPVESTVIMEAVIQREKAAVASVLGISDIENIARIWAKERARKGQEAILLICPVKCESYLADNGGHRDLADELFDKVCRHYQDVITAVRKETSLVTIKYIPIDTIGCVELVEGKWHAEEHDPSSLYFSGNYRVTGSGKQSIVGADAVLLSLSKHIVSQARNRIRSLQREIEKLETDLAEKVESEFWGTIFFYTFGYRTKSRSDLFLLRDKMEATVTRLKLYEGAINSVSTKPMPQRVREL